MNTTTNHNGRLAVQIEDARACLADLARLGLHIDRVEIGRLPLPRIVLDAPWPTPGGLEGGLKATTSRGGQRIHTYATRLHECQVEWEVPA